MRFILSLILGGTLIFSVPLPVKASETLEKKYLEAYQLVRQAFEDKKSGGNRIALQKFQTAKQILWEIHTENPKWHVQTVNYLAQDCEKQIQGLYQDTGVRSTGVESEQKVDRLINELIGIQRNRETVAITKQKQKRTPQIEKKSRIPVLSNLIKGKAPQKAPEKISVAKPKSNRVRQVKGDPRMLVEKVEALEASFLKKKKEVDQWRLQYSILEEKAREEIQSLSSEFAKEKTDLEVEISSLKKQIRNEKVAYQEQDQNLSSLKQQLKAQKSNQESLRQSAIRIEELERALQEAQAIRSKAEEESKILEGQIVLRIKKEFQQKQQSLLKQLQIEKDKYAQLEQQVSGESSKKLAEKNTKISLLEEKIVNAVREKAIAVKNESQLKEALSRQEKKVDELEQKLASKQEQGSKALEQKINKIESRLAFKDKVIRDLEAKVSEKEKSLETERNLIAGLKAQLKAKGKEGKGSEAILAEQKRVIQGLEEKNKKLAGGLSKVEQKLEKYKEEKEYFLQEEKKYKASKTAYEKTKSDLNLRINRLEQNLNKTRSELARKEGAVRKALIEADEKLAQSKFDNEKTIMNLLESFKREKSKWTSEIKALNVQLEDRGDQAELLASLQKAESDLDISLKNNETLRAKVQTLEGQVQSLEQVQAQKDDSNAKEKLFAQLKQKDEINQKQTQEITGFEQRVNKLRNLLENSENEKKSLYEEVNQLNSMVAQLRLDLKRTDDINAQLRDTVSRIQIRTPVVLAQSSKREEQAKQQEPVSPTVKKIEKKMAASQPKSNQALTEEQVQKVIKKVKYLFLNKKFNEALKLLQEQLRVYPSNDRFMFYRALTLSRLNRMDESIQAYEETVEVNPRFAKAFNNLGNLYSQQKKYGKAIENLKKATEHDANLSEAYNNMGIVYSHLGQFDESITAFIRATELNPRLVAAYYNLGQIYYHDKKWDAASTSFKKVLSLKPNHVEAKDYIAQISKEKSDGQTHLALEPQVD